MVEETSMSERANILARIREALAVPARHGPQSDSGSAHWGFDAVLPAVPSTVEERWARFEKEALELRAEVRRLSGVAEAPAVLRALQTEEGWTRVASHRAALTEPAVSSLGLPVVWMDDGPEPGTLESCPVGISECDCLVAQTGTVVVTSRSAGGRALSVLPPHHVVLARIEQLVGGLPDAFALLAGKYGDDYPSMISFISGPSRTGDIERILVLGAHGPRKLTVLCI
jgi:L-lactate dehydrogenase complex protein LldG